MSYNISPSLFDLVYSVGYSLSYSMLLQMALLYFKWLSNIPLCICTPSSLFIHLWMAIWFVSISWLLSSIAVFTFWSNPHIVLHRGCTNLQSHQQCRSVSFSQYPLQHLLFVDFFLWPPFDYGVRWYLIAVSICIFKKFWASFHVSHCHHMYI